MAITEVSILGDDDSVFGIRHRRERRISCPIAVGQLRRVDRVMTGGVQ
jgi:hypothetical protein